MSQYIGKQGFLRIYDSTAELRSLAGGNVEWFDDSAGTFNDVTAAARSAAGSATGSVLSENADYLYVGHTSPFARIQCALDTAAVGAGALTVEYWNGSSWVSVVDLNDGTASGGNTLAQAGSIDFQPPIDWALRGHASLDATKFYVRLTTAGTASTPPDFEQVWPVDGQYYDLKFEEMDLSAPEGRGRPDEVPRLHRTNLDERFHYTEGSDEKLVEPLELSFSLRLADELDGSGSLSVYQALTCGNPNQTGWTVTGVSTKGDCKNDGVNANPTFADGGPHKTVAVAGLWFTGANTDDATTPANRIGRFYGEVYFPPEQIEISESEDGVTVSATGLIYGTIEEIGQLAYRY